MNIEIKHSKLKETIQSTFYFFLLEEWKIEWIKGVFLKLGNLSDVDKDVFFDEFDGLMKNHQKFPKQNMFSHNKLFNFTKTRSETYDDSDFHLSIDIEEINNLYELQDFSKILYSFINIFFGIRGYEVNWDSIRDFYNPESYINKETILKFVEEKKAEIVLEKKRIRDIRRSRHCGFHETI